MIILFCAILLALLVLFRFLKKWLFSKRIMNELLPTIASRHAVLSTRPSSPIRVALVGIGIISELHARYYLPQGELDEGELKGDDHDPRRCDSTDAILYAVCDLDPELVEKRQREWNVECAFTSYDALLQDPLVDAVEILTPTPHHCWMAIKALQAGKHVHVQKPVTISLAESLQLLAEVRNHPDLVCKLAENYVFHPSVVRAKELLDSGRIGRLLSIRCHVHGAVKAVGGWKVNEAWEWRLKESEEGRGIMTFDHGHHLYSVLWFLGGEIESVHAYIDSYDGVVDSPATISVRFRSHDDRRAHGSVCFTMSNEMSIMGSYYSSDEWIEITGSAGVILLPKIGANLRSDAPLLSLFDGQSVEWTHFSDLNSDWGVGFRLSEKNFVDSIRGRSDPIPNMVDAQKVLMTCLAVSRSARLGRSVLLDELLMPWPSFQDFSRFAHLAESLTEGLPSHLSSTVDQSWKSCLSLHVTPVGETPELRVGLFVENGVAELREGLPDEEEAVFSIVIDAGSWAAVLLGKAGARMMAVRGKLKFTGDVQEGLKLLSAFQI